MTSTFAGDRPSTRYRDLVDIVLIAQSQTVDATELRVAVESECHHRGHSLPLQLTLPDKTWRNGYSAIARTVPDLSVQAADDALTIAVSLFQPIFDGRADGTWEPSEQRWVRLAPACLIRAYNKAQQGAIWRNNAQQLHVRKPLSTWTNTSYAGTMRPARKR
ncbi:nucleotidyl transferase AbiEii/AbiGii toxin family protein, partial [Ilumatobacter sp.]